MVATIPTPTTSEDIIMSSTDYNQTTKVVLAMPITTSNRYQNNKWYFQILINGSQNAGVKGYVVGWQLNNFDFNSHHGQNLHKFETAHSRYA